MTWFLYPSWFMIHDRRCLKPWKLQHSKFMIYVFGSLGFEWTGAWAITLLVIGDGGIVYQLTFLSQFDLGCTMFWHQGRNIVWPSPHSCSTASCSCKVQFYLDVWYFASEGHLQLSNQRLSQNRWGSTLHFDTSHYRFSKKTFQATWT